MKFILKYIVIFFSDKREDEQSNIFPNYSRQYCWRTVQLFFEALQNILLKQCSIEKKQVRVHLPYARALHDSGSARFVSLKVCLIFSPDIHSLRRNEKDN
jgi:hypothetical protein